MSWQPKYRALTLLAGALIAAVLAGCAAEQAHRRGMELVADGKRQEGLVELQKAVRLEPNNAQYRIDYRNQLLQDLAAAVERAQLAQGAGDIAGARAGYADALKIDPTNEAVRRALAMLDMEQRMRAIVAEAEKLADAGHVEAARDMLRSALADNPASAAIARALVQMQARLDKADEARQAKLAASSVMKRPVTLAVPRRQPAHGVRSAVAHDRTQRDPGPRCPRRPEDHDFRSRCLGRRHRQPDPAAEPAREEGAEREHAVHLSRDGKQAEGVPGPQGPYVPVVQRGRQARPERPEDCAEGQGHGAGRAHEHPGDPRYAGRHCCGRKTRVGHRPRRCRGDDGSATAGNHPRSADQPRRAMAEQGDHLDAAGPADT